MTRNLSNQPELWLEFARLNPREFRVYDGYCRCCWCEDYRARASEWIKGQLEQREET